MVFFAFEQLPNEIQQYIKQGEQIAIVEQGKTIANIAQIHRTPSYAKGDFDYDLERMKRAVEAPYVVMPHFDNDDDFFDWIENLTDADFVAEKSVVEQV